MSNPSTLDIDAAGDAPDRVIAVDAPEAVFLALASSNGTWDTGHEVAEATMRNLRPRLRGRTMNEGLVDLVTAHREAYEVEAIPHEGSGSIDVMLARMTSATVELAWAGGCRAYLIRRSAIIAHARPHCHGEAYISATLPREKAYELYDGRMFMRTRSFGDNMHASPAPQPTLERLVEPWPVVPGDTLVMMNDRVWRMLSDVEILRLVRKPHPAIALVEAAGKPGWKTAAIVVQRV